MRKNEAPEQTAQEIIEEFLYGLKPVQRVKVARFLANRDGGAKLVSSIADDTTEMLTEDRTHEELAELFEVSRGRIDVIVSRTRKRRRESALNGMTTK